MYDIVLARVTSSPQFLKHPALTVVTQPVSREIKSQMTRGMSLTRFKKEEQRDIKSKVQ